MKRNTNTLSDTENGPSGPRTVVMHAPAREGKNKKKQERGNKGQLGPLGPPGPLRPKPTTAFNWSIPDEPAPKPPAESAHPLRPAVAREGRRTPPREPIPTAPAARVPWGWTPEDERRCAARCKYCGQGIDWGEIEYCKPSADRTGWDRVAGPTRRMPLNPDLSPHRCQPNEPTAPVPENARGETP